MLPYKYNLFFDIKTEEQLKIELDHIIHKLATLARFRREDGKSIDDYIMLILKSEGLS